MGQSVAEEPRTGYQLDPASVGVTLGTPGMVITKRQIMACPVQEGKK